MSPSRLGTRIGRYDILAELGRGGMSVVYRARDTHLRRDVALKLLHPHLAELPEARERFRREAVAVARLHHPHIVQIHDFSDALNAETYLVMACVNGVPLAQVLEDLAPEGGMLPEAAVVLARAVADALVAAHEAEIVHRDLKPENILVASDGTLKLTDFGIARVLDNQTMTMTGALLGSPAYMAPEYIEGGPSDARADFFSLGVMLYQMCTGRLPFEGAAPHAVLKKIASGVYTPAEEINPGIHAEIGRIIRRCMANRAQDRHPDAAALRTDIDRFLGRLNLDVDVARSAILADARRYAEDAHAPLAARYKALGRAALRAGEMNAALAHFDRVLSLGEDDEVRRTLRSLARRGWARRALWGATALAGAVALALALHASTAEQPEFSLEQPSEPLAVPQAPKKVEHPPRQSAPSTRVDETPPPKAPTLPRPNSHPAKKPPPPSAPLPTREVTFKPAGSWVTLTVDNAAKPVVENAMRSFSVPLTHGKHKLRFTNPMAHPFETDITVDDRDTRPMVVRLVPLDAHLLIEGAPEGSRVAVGDRQFVLSQGNPRETLAVPLSEAGHGVQMHEVVVYSPDGKTELHRGLLRFRPGETRALALAAGPD